MHDSSYVKLSEARPTYICLPGIANILNTATSVPHMRLYLVCNSKDSANIHPPEESNTKCTASARVALRHAYAASLGKVGIEPTSKKDSRFTACRRILRTKQAIVLLLQERDELAETVEDLQKDLEAKSAALDVANATIDRQNAEASALVQSNLVEDVFAQTEVRTIPKKHAYLYILFGLNSGPTSQLLSTAKNRFSLMFECYQNAALSGGRANPMTDRRFSVPCAPIG